MATKWRDATTRIHRPNEVDGSPTIIDQRPTTNSTVRPTKHGDEPAWASGSARHALRQRAGRRVGRVIAGRYPLLSLVGVGSAGAVYEAYDRETTSPVAIKVLHDGLRASDEHVARFMREARAASDINHPSIIKVADVGQDEYGHIFMVLELLTGEPLIEAIAEQVLPLDDAIAVGRQLLSGLDAAHARGIIHRDVKPENIFLNRQDESGVRVHLLDFGIAKYLAADPSSFHTLDGITLGTPNYMSPEQCRGEKATPLADLWSVGAVLYHTLAGGPPFDDTQLGRLLIRIVTESAPSLATRRPDLPAGIVEVVDRALLRDPARRWRSAREMLDGLTFAALLVDIEDIADGDMRF